MSSQEPDDPDQRRRRQNRMAQRAHSECLRKEFTYCEISCLLMGCEPGKAIRDKLDRLAELETAAAASSPPLARISDSNNLGCDDLSADVLDFDLASVGDHPQNDRLAQSGSIPVSIPPIYPTRQFVGNHAPLASFHILPRQHTTNSSSGHMYCVGCIHEGLESARTRTSTTTFPHETVLPPTPSSTSITPDQSLELNLLASHNTNSMSVSPLSVGNTAIHQACNNGHADVVKLLLDRGASALETNADGQTILHVACAKGHTNIVRMLLHRGLNPEQKDFQGMSPLYLAASNGHTDIVGLLIDSGASTVTRYD